jgi:hypothetical protein
MKEKGIRWGRRTEAGLLLLIGIVLGACREFLFINLNYQIDHVARHTRFSYAHSLFQGWTRGMGLGVLLTLKWVLALAFILAMLALSVVMSRVLFHTWRHTRPLVIGFAAFAIVSVALHALAYWRPDFEMVSIHLSHMLQYPVVLLFLLLAAGLPGVRGFAE